MHRSAIAIAIAIAATAALVASGCGGSGDDDQPQSSRSRTSDAQPADDVVSDQDVDIGGRTLYLRCWGEEVAGEPTVLLLSGSGPPTSIWETMAADLAADGHHLCAYDRLGIGRSDALPEGTRTTEDQVDDLVALLDAADLPDPVVLTAHSLASLPALGLVDRAPERVSGVVLVDPWLPRVGPIQQAALPPEEKNESRELAEERRFLTDFRYDPAQNLEHLLLADEDEDAMRLLDAAGPLFGDRPVVVLQRPPPRYSPGLPRSWHRSGVAAIKAGGRELAAESTHGTFTTVRNTGHDIQVDRPEVVADAILDVMDR
jgi:pimeloyl-ACP methyl ester carboxylesterase